MSKFKELPIWKKAPFIRLLLPLMVGIVWQWYQQFDWIFPALGTLCFALALVLFARLPLAARFKLNALQGILLFGIIVTVGMLLVWQKDIRHHHNWYGLRYQNDDALVLRIDELLLEKTKSFKATAAVETILQSNQAIACKGKLLLYFKKDALPPNLHYGDKILLHKKLQPIKNSGNPGAFDYQRYAAFHGNFHQVFLQPQDWIKLDEKRINFFQQFLFVSNEKIRQILQKNIPANTDALGIAEALLIGYTNDLDKDLVQAYSNTGVVHIIAISGMHLGLIYVLLVWLFGRMPLIKKSKFLQVALILGCLWLFALLTGGAASVLRSAVMFTFIAIGKNFFRQASIYNSLAASAFAMLCYNPYFLWDVGFQLSYLAVIGIIAFQQSIYNWWFIRNKWLNEIWKLVAISLAAQVLTFPICLYYFHQFPLLFLLTNLVAVPLSTLILYAEIALVALAWIPFLGHWLGLLVGWLVWAMSAFIVAISRLSFALWDNIPATVLSTWLLYAIVIGCCAWLLRKTRPVLHFTLACLFAFAFLQALYKWQIQQQQKLIVYNVAQHQAIDFIAGNHCQFLGDSVLLDGSLYNFHLKPAHILFQLQPPAQRFPSANASPFFYQWGGKKIAVIERPLQMAPPARKIAVDMIVISRSPKLSMASLDSVFSCGQYVFDASNPLWKIGQWQKDCSALHLRSYSIPDQGAFVLDL